MDKKKESIHKAHRKRMRERFDKVGFEGWSKVEVLEFLLYSVFKRQDTNPIAHKLLDYNHNSFVNMLKNADNFGMSEHIDGVGTNTVLYLRSLRMFMDYYRNEQLKENPIKLTSANFADFLRTIEFSDETEEIVLICLDRNMRTKCVIRLTEDSDYDYAVTKIDKLVRAATQSGAANVILVHNHPSGHTAVSLEDINMTMRTRDILRPFGIHFVDHFIVCGDEVVSIVMTMAENMKKTGTVPSYNE